MRGKRADRLLRILLVVGFGLQDQKTFLGGQQVNLFVVVAGVG